MDSPKNIVLGAFHGWTIHLVLLAFILLHPPLIVLFLFLYCFLSFSLVISCIFFLFFIFLSLSSLFVKLFNPKFSV